MIVCICRRLNDKKITEAIDAGAGCPNAVMKHHGTRFNCGQCREEIRAVMAERNEALQAQNGIAAE